MSATSVDGSRPTSSARAEAPSCATISNSPSSASAFSAATTSPGRQTKPLDWARSDFTETTLGAAPRTRPAMAAEKALKGEGLEVSDMVRSFPPLDVAGEARRHPRQMGGAPLEEWGTKSVEFPKDRHFLDKGRSVFYICSLPPRRQPMFGFVS